MAFANETNSSANPSEEVVRIRGINSNDPDEDIVSWSISFGDGTSTGTRSWSLEPPIELTHTYAQPHNILTLELTVTDAGDRSSTDSIDIAIIFSGQD